MTKYDVYEEIVMRGVGSALAWWDGWAGEMERAADRPASSRARGRRHQLAATSAAGGAWHGLRWAGRWLGGGYFGAIWRAATPRGP